MLHDLAHKTGTDCEQRKRTKQRAPWKATCTSESSHIGTDADEEHGDVLAILRRRAPSYFHISVVKVGGRNGKAFPPADEEALSARLLRRGSLR